MMDIQSVGNRVRRLRLASGLGQVELADRIGIASGTVSMIETGALPLPQAHVGLLAHTLGVTEAYLLRNRAEPVTTRPLLRAYADAPKKLVDTLSSDIATAVEAIEDLSLKRVPDSLLYYDEDLNDDDAIERFAAEIRTRAGLSGHASSTAQFVLQSGLVALSFPWIVNSGAISACRCGWTMCLCFALVGPP